MMSGQKIVLMGFMGSGKSTVAEALAARLKLDYIDLDEYIEKEEKAVVSLIFEEKGEAYFRKIEQEYLSQILQSKEAAVVALGGGTPCNDEIWNQLLDTYTVYLKMGINALSSRLTGVNQINRPLIRKMDKAELHSFVKAKLRERRIYYERANLTVLAAIGSASDICARIVDNVTA